MEQEGQEQRVVAVLVLALLLSLPMLVFSSSVFAASSGPAGETGGEKGLLVVVTFPNLAKDVSQLLCSGDRVEAIAPPGVDPHEYQLTSRDTELLREADIVVSTGHAPFEKGIERLAAQGLLRGVLVVVPRLPGLRLSINPSTGQPNYHMPVYDPANYVVFLRGLAQALSSMRPGCRDFYWSRAAEAAERVAGIVATTPLLHARAVVDTPAAQYAVEWAGVEVAAILVREHGAQVAPRDIEAAEKILAEGGLAVVTTPVAGKAGQLLLELARKHGASILQVPSPLGEKSIVEKLVEISSQAKKLWKGARPSPAMGGETPGLGGRETTWPLLLGLLAALAAFGLILAPLGSRR